MTSGDVVPVILCGGRGARLWPLSRAGLPKQFVRLHDRQSLFEKAVARADYLNSPLPSLFVTLEEYRFLVSDELKSLSRQGDIVAEPVGRNTAASFCIAALTAMSKHGDPVLVILPSDQILADEKRLQKSVQDSLAYVRKNIWVLLGAEPLNGFAQYGYIQPGREMCESGTVKWIAGFIEKPRSETGEKLMKAGWLWHTGISVVKASVVVETIKRIAPNVFENCYKAFELRAETPEYIFTDANCYEALPSEQIDSAVYEKSDKMGVVRLAGQWRDIGSWETMAQQGEKAPERNRFQGDVVMEETANTYVHANDRLVVTLGVKDLTIVDTRDVLLVAGKGALGKVADLAQKLEHQNRCEATSDTRVVRKWGHYEVIESRAGCKVKNMYVRPGGSTSRQFHYHRNEHWVVVRGTATVTCDDRTFEIGTDESAHIPKGAIHKLENMTDQPLELIEVQTGGSLVEEDIVRLEESYGR